MHFFGEDELLIGQLFLILLGKLFLILLHTPL